MAFKIRKVDYYYATVKDQPGEAYKLLSLFAETGINLWAFHAIPIGPSNSQLTLFPEDPQQLERTARKSGLSLDGPHPALLVQGDDELGALVGIHAKLYEADVNVFASNGITDGDGSFGYIIYVSPKDYERATQALGV